MQEGPSKLGAALLVVEAIICFALPVYLWLLGVLTAPLWYYAARRAGTFPVWSSSYVLGGCLGLAALISLLRYLLAREAERELAFTRNVLFAGCGLLSAWGYVTTDFRYFDADGFTGLAAGVPSLCFAHLLFLAHRKAKSRHASAQAPR